MGRAELSLGESVLSDIGSQSDTPVAGDSSIITPAGSPEVERLKSPFQQDTRNKNLELEAGRLEIETLLTALRVGQDYRNAPTATEYPDLLVPAICDISGRELIVPKECTPAAFNILNNDTDELVRYPLVLNEGHYFSEIVAADFPERAQYRCWVDDCMAIIDDSLDACGVLPYSKIDQVGRELQQRDGDFARSKIDFDLDAIHELCGVDAEHPYRKMTLCRTTVLVSVLDEIVPFFYEKFLVAYSYSDASGKRRSTITPIHGHPLSHEVVYFTNHGPNTKVIEQEYEVCDRDGRPLFLADGALNPALIGEDGLVVPEELRVELRDEHVLYGTDEPLALDPFESEHLLRSAAHIYQTDGLFRPHKVYVCGDMDDEEEEVRYFAVNNYWGPLGRVWVFDESGHASSWSHRSWSGEQLSAEEG